MIEPGLSEPEGQIRFGGGGGNRTRVHLAAGGRRREGGDFRERELSRFGR